MAFRPTEEQQQAVDAFATGDDMVIEAYAGSGKTSTLKLLAKQVPDDRCVYLAYNKAIATDAASSFPRNTVCKTAHSFAFGAVGKKFSSRLQAPRQTGYQAANILGIRQTIELGDVRLSPSVQARLAKETVLRFCYSADDMVLPHHVPFTPGVPMDVLRTIIYPFAKRVWEDAQRLDGALKFEHDYYLKMWAMGNPRLPGDAIFLDEAQDANPVIAQVVANQKHAQKVLVGDANQQIYEWRGAVDAMKEFPTDHRIFLTKSFRFGAAVADEANKWLGLLGAPHPLIGFDKIPSTVERLTTPDAVLCRTNSGVIEQAFAAEETGRSFAVVGGTAHIERFADGAEALMAGKSSSHPDLIAFRDWNAVLAYVNEEGGGDLKTLVKMIDKYGADVVRRVASGAVRETDADVVLSTAHKSKGREWSSVAIAGDFTEPEPQKDGTDGEVPRADLMLCYVSVTRAMNKLDQENLDWVNRRIPQEINK